MAPEWCKFAAHSYGLGWFRRRGRESIWTPDASGGVPIRNLLRCTTKQNAVRTREIEIELRDELDVPIDAWDAGDVLGLPDGCALNLATGKVRKARAAEHISKRLAVMPEAGEAAEWLRFLSETLADLSEPEKVIAWLRWWLRYSLGRGCEDESLVFLFGPPGSGKSTLADTWAWIAGDYTATRSGERLAALAGKRVVRVGELPNGGRWAVGPLNSLASGETIETNLMRQNSIEFQSCAKLLISGNHRPDANSGSGLFRRLRLIECRRVPERPDAGLKDRLLLEGGRILQWALDARGKPAVPAQSRTRPKRTGKNPTCWPNGWPIAAKSTRTSFRHRPRFGIVSV